jgi:tRNA U34 5-carboxymethylaminomethyl modifying enzyme MnmG/GidA
MNFKFEEPSPTIDQRKASLKDYICASGPHSFSTTSNSIENINTGLSENDVKVVVGNRAHMKMLVKKQAKLELRALRKAEKVIPHVTKMVVDMANMIENRLKAQVNLSNIKYSVFIEKSEQNERKF